MVQPITLNRPAGLKARAQKAVGSASSRMKLAACYGAATILMTTAPTLCAPNTLDSLVLSLLDFIYTLARIVGIVIAVNGAFNWVLANKDENADGQARGIKLVICGLALCFLEGLVTPIIKAAGFTV